MFGRMPIVIASALGTALTFFALEAGAMPMPLELFRPTKPKQFSTQIPPEMNGKVRYWVKFFSKNDRARFDRFMTRGALYKTLIQDILVEHGVPAEMYYLAMVESGFARKARSHARAVGVWQFMAPTGREYGLRIDGEVDERMDVIRATRAAAKMLRDLYDEFEDWNLVMAAYNCGAGCVRSAARRGGTWDYWRLARWRRLPSETANYVPKFHAAMLIAKNPEKYGFKRKIHYEYPRMERIHVAGRTPLAVVAKRRNVPHRALVAFNPHLLRERTPRDGYSVWIPSRSMKKRL